MEKVLESVNNNKIIILFVATVLILTMYMGLSERKLSSIQNNNIAQTK